jgi:hypothetical protein
MLKLSTRLSLLLVLQGMAGLASAGVLLEKVTFPGFVRQEYAISTRCTLSDGMKAVANPVGTGIAVPIGTGITVPNGVLVMESQLGSLKSKRQQPLQLSAEAIKAVITVASLTPIISHSFPVDAGTQIYRAYQKKADGSVKSVLLWEQNGGTGTENINSSAEALMLRNFIDLNCGNPLQQ